jgi:hypothetical protein
MDKKTAALQVSMVANDKVESRAQREALRAFKEGNLLGHFHFQDLKD